MSKKSFLKKFYPDEYYESIFNIDFKWLQKRNIKGLLIDLDNTIVPRKEREVSKNLIEWFSELSKKGFKVCIISNNWKARTGKIGKSLGVPVVARAVKPRRKAFERGMKILKTNREQTAVIGDQIFTDVFGGNRMNLLTILVVPLSKSDLFYTKILRKLERLILKGYKGSREC
ncbi:YqeG family HAD IIIA-type phosphatase [Candidatus Oleimmundimicrobium sp.]|uniref:YqeG family HAD IIIA-type phosphatase n=1 Tax=Candidatus Oleimmundimicrobium sp. TaxID=3060597 RepID=UPI002721E9E0|nr:YqeG family HAD IIIA-type phosphatase [Candidatus Oleimmundimicrobium sp.]MDO8886745.1 YqeG family HAD IIIA-type phosphatase [Candidatus Oleimmundimicrobium sp.]